MSLRNPLREFRKGTNGFEAVTIDGASYTVDAAGNRTSRTPLPGGTATNFAYDAIYELLNATQGSTTKESYTYDAVGNRQTSLGVPSYIYNNSNELTSSSLATFTYDNNGNTLTKAASGATTTYAWDYENRLSSATLPGSGGTVSFKYDPFGRRIYKSSSNGTSVFAYDGDNLVEETNSSGTAVARYSLGLNIDEPLAMLRSSATSYYDADGLGSITSLSSSAGALAQTYGYDSFGKQISSSGSLTNPFQYTGREFDPETNLYSYRARYYDPQVGRFVSEDPVLFYGGVDFYVYADDSPQNFVDPSGLAPGDKYGTRRQAGVQAIRDILLRSVCENTEFAGALYKNPDGTYSYTAPRGGGPAGSTVHPSDIPRGGQFAGDYHTHGAYDPNYDNEVFGTADMDANDAEGPAGLPGYLGTPRGAIKVYLGNRAHPRHGRIITIVPASARGNQLSCDCSSESQ